MSDSIAPIDQQPDARSVQGCDAIFLVNSLLRAGSETKTVRVVNKLIQCGLAVELAYLNPIEELLGEVDERVPVHFLDRRGKLSFRALRELRRQIVRSRARKVICINLFPLLYAHISAAFLPEERRPRFVLFENTVMHYGLTAWVMRRISKFLMRRTQLLVFGSDVQRSLWQKIYGFKRDRSRVIYNGVDSDYFSANAEFRRDSSTKVSRIRERTRFLVGSVGSLLANKNHIEVVRALIAAGDRIPGAGYVVVGDGPEANRLFSTAANSELGSRIGILGKLSDVRPMLDVIDVFVLPSLMENFSNATLEAMAMGKPVVVSKTGGMPEMVTHGHDGFLYEAGDVDELMYYLCKLAADPVLRRKLGTNARSSVLNRFSIDGMLERYKEILSA